MAGERPERRGIIIGRSVTAPIVLAITTAAALGGAILALLPAAVRRRPAGRLGARREPDAGERLRSELTSRADGPPPDPASEPLTP